MDLSLEILIEALKSTKGKICASSYYVPRFLIEDSGSCEVTDVGNPLDFYRHCIDGIINSKTPAEDGTVVYSSFIRFSSSLNFEPGSALKQIAFLPYLKQRLNVGTIIFLPTSEIGVRDRKGDAGSPFAIKNPFQVDASLADPILPIFSAIQQYRILVSACKKMGFRVGSIVPLATMAIDAPALIDQPALTYWWHKSAKEKMYRHQLPANSIEQFTNNEYAALFAESFSGENIASGSLSHLMCDSPNSIVNALPDPMVADPNTYTWSDVASVRYSVQPMPPTHGNGPSRVWDYDLPAFDLMSRILKWREEELGENVFLLDVANSVPGEVIRRSSLKDSVIVGEYTSHFSPPTKEIDISTGPILMGAGANWADPKVHIDSFYECLRELCNESDDVRFFAGIGNHDSRPAPQRALIGFLAATWLLPGSIPFIYSGAEFENAQPTNCEFGYSSKDLEHINAHELPLFTAKALEWSSCTNGKPVIDFLKRITACERGIKGEFDRGMRMVSVGKRADSVHYSIGSLVHSDAFINVVYNRGPRTAHHRLRRNEEVIFQTANVRFVNRQSQKLALEEFSTIITRVEGSV